MTDIAALISSVLLVGILLLVGDALTALGTGRVFVPRQPRTPLVVELRTLVASMILFIGAPIVMVVLLDVKPNAEPSLRPIEAQTIADLLIVAALIPIMLSSKRNHPRDYGFDLRGWLAEVRVGTLGFLASVPPVLAMLMVTLPLRSKETAHPFLKLLEADSRGRAVLEIALAAVVVAPLTEELIFRVVLQGFLESIAPPAAAILLPAIAFAAVHGALDALPLLPLAIILGLVFHVRRSYVAVVILHALFNAANLILALAGH